MVERMRAMREEKGFTLIELLIVIVILGILAAIVVFAIGGITDKGKNSACKSDYKNVEVAQEAFYAKSQSSGTGAYAGSVDALVTANLLREAPSTANYTIATTTSGVVTVNGSAGTGSCPA
jgi:prepilin-type N-terminal cleavage/methylation domain-containing protein